jgi:ankyrin repeat protein
MHRAAAYGNAFDVETLIRRGAKYALKTFKLLWTPIFCAVQFGNLSTFNTLLEYEPDILNHRDIRGWTLLHIAVNAKQTEVVRLLLLMGADPHARTFATDYCVPKALKGISVTPGDIAVLRGPRTLKSYLSVLNASGYDVQVFEYADNTLRKSKCLMWDALESLT